MKKSKGKEGVTCECGRFEPFSVYAYAHKNVPLVFTCKKCGKQYDVIDLTATPK